MKIVYLNLNYGRNDLEGVLNFISQQKDCDVFCFQEIKGEIKEKISETLKNFECGFISKEFGELENYNIASYINKKHLNFSFEILEENMNETAPAVFLEVESGNSKWNILNFHGSSKPGDKLDNTARIEASNRIINFMRDKEGVKIIGGDFNLLPNTQSIMMFEENGYKNLIKEFHIETTRNDNAWKLYENKQLFADYIFISYDTEIKNFKVIDSLISDHLPLILEI